MAAFTALNGGSPKQAEVVNGSVEQSRAGSAEQTNGQTSRPESRAALEVSTSQREREAWSSSNHDRPPYPSTAYPEVVENPHKRKRSISDEPRREARPTTADRSPEHAPHNRPQSETREPYDTPQREYRSYADERRDHDDTWYSQSREDRAYDSHQSGLGSAQSDDQIETLRRANQMDDDYQNGSPDGDDRSVSMYTGQYSSEQRRDGVVQSEAKKRKRNFSNRTKTGCMTCRKRKKKCDEMKPECNNCVRGGFVCAGYPPQRGTWQKQEHKPTTIQIESKDPTYVPPGAYGMPQQHPYGSQPPPPTINPPQKRDSLPSYRGQTLRIDPPQGRPLQTDDDRPTASTLPSASVTSPDNKLSAMSAYNTAANVFPTPVSAAPITAFSDRTPKEYQRVPPLHDLTRTEPDTPQQSKALPQINLLHPSRTNSPPSQSSQPSQHPASGVQATAQLALSHTQLPTNRPRREKEEMLKGRSYYPFDKELVLERERCSAACWRFNNSTNPNLGVSPGERARLFRDILQPKDILQTSPTASSPPLLHSRVGENAAVEAPFTCDYGYNIQIGNDVLIGRNCLINDVCEVRIGNKVVIGPNVCIYTGTCSTDYGRRAGSRGPQYGQPIVIEDDVFIGGNVIILPGVTIGRGSTVGAGSVVTKSVSRWSVSFGVPARTQRGVNRTSF